MNETKEVPLSGYNLELVFSGEQHFEGMTNYEGLPDAAAPSVNFGWDWQIQGDDRFVVIITLSVEPTRQRPERATVNMAGVFHPVGEKQTVPFQEFVFTHAPTILLPYAREAISSLTGRGLYGALHLPPINVMALMKQMNPQVSTGNEQLLARPGAAQRLGIGAGVSVKPRKRVTDESPAKNAIDSLE
jgi:preprotein translocase subunit SecB